MTDKPTADKNARTLSVILLVVACMVGMSFAAVPLYKLFCSVTGYGGTTQRGGAFAEHPLARTVEIRFDSHVNRTILWDFTPDQRSVTVHLGQKGLAGFTAHNRDSVKTTGVAIYNVSPPKAGRYFHKIQCFCFGEQSLNPGEKIDMPVVFYVDPAMDSDPNMDDVRSITLSYTFFASGTPELDSATQEFYNPEATAGTVALPAKKQ